MDKANTDREEMSKKLLDKGQASLLEILTASFGEWPPRGLDVDNSIRHETQVVLQRVSGLGSLSLNIF